MVAHIVLGKCGRIREVASFGRVNISVGHISTPIVTSKIPVRTVGLKMDRCRIRYQYLQWDLRWIDAG